MTLNYTVETPDLQIGKTDKKSSTQSIEPDHQAGSKRVKQLSKGGTWAFYLFTVYISNHLYPRNTPCSVLTIAFYVIIDRLLDFVIRA